MEGVLRTATRLDIPLITTLLLVSSLYASVLHVPGEYPTVQAAFDGVQAGDTVLVALGLYSETLTAPALPFVLKGDVVADTGDYPRPIIDPAALPGSDSLRCMVVPAGSVPVIEDIRFRNGPGMFPRYNFRHGGLSFQNGQATFRRCVFDSLYWAITVGSSGNFPLRLEQCRFLKCRTGIYGFPAHIFVEATDCLFSGSGPHISAYAGCHLERCRFGQTWDNPMVWALFGVVSIHNCQFGPPLPGDSLGLWAALYTSFVSGEIADNLFTGIQLGQGFVNMQCACDGSTPLRVTRNRFVHNRVTRPIGSTAIDAYCESDSTCGLEIDSNLFEDNTDNRAAAARGILLFGGADALAIGNRFHDITVDTVHSPLPVPVVYLGDSSTIRLAGNRFDTTGLALMDHRTRRWDSLDARGNWWGSPTGPYHAIDNPSGSGDTVVGPLVQVGPWCTDTSCTITSAADPPFILHPSSFLLSAYPNPFNSTTVIRLQVPQAEIVRVELFDVLGRRVKELWSGVVAEEKEIAFDGNALASGVYFVRATNTIWSRPLVTTKLVLLK